MFIDPKLSTFIAASRAPRDLLEQIAHQRVAVDGIHILAQRPPAITAVMVIVLRNRRRFQAVEHELPVLVEQPADRRHIPDDAAPYAARGVGVRLVNRLLAQIIAQRRFAAQPVFQLRPGGCKARYNARARQNHQRRAAVVHHARGGDVLHAVEFLVVMPFKTRAAQPHHDDLLRDGRIDQQRGGDVRDRADGGHIQRLFARILRGACGQILRGGRNHGLFFAGQIAFAALEYRHVLLREGEQLADFVVAFLHAVLGAGGAGVPERRGIQRLEADSLLGLERIGNGKLIVDFVVRVGIEHQIEHALRRIEQLQTLFEGHMFFLPDRVSHFSAF